MKLSSNKLFRGGGIQTSEDWDLVPAGIFKFMENRTMITKKILSAMVVFAASLAVMAVAACGSDPTPVPAATAVPATAVPETITLKLTTHSPGPGTPRSDWVPMLADLVEERTNGQVKIEIFWADVLVKAKEQLEGVQNGVADMADLSVGYFGDKIKLYQGPGQIPFVDADPVKMYNAMWRVFEEVPETLTEIEKFNQKVLGVTVTNSYQLPSNTIASSLADIKGMKIGTFGRTAPKIIAAAGGDAVSTTGSEMYEALQHGVIEARILSYEASKRFSLQEVVKYIIEVDLGSLAGAAAITINTDSWNKLTPQNQQILSDAAKEVGAWEADAMGKGRDDYRAWLVDKGIEIIKFPAAERDKWKNLIAVQSISADWAAGLEAEGLPGKKVLDILTAG